MLAESRKALLGEQLTLFIHTPTKLVSQRDVGALVCAELGYASSQAICRCL
jgi:hypothetical protein